MAEVDVWERRLVEAYVERSMRDRYLEMLNGPKRRQKLLDRLNHNPGFDFSNARDLGSIDADGLVALLTSLRVEPTGRLMADGSELDGRELRLELAVEELMRTQWGAVLICPPKPIAVYRGEAPGSFYLFSCR